jgi:hypothetical protein
MGGMRKTADRRGDISGYFGSYGLEEGELRGEGRCRSGDGKVTYGAEKLNMRDIEKAAATKDSYGVWRFRGIPGLSGWNEPK